LLVVVRGDSWWSVVVCVSPLFLWPCVWWRVVASLVCGGIPGVAASLACGGIWCAEASLDIQFFKREDVAPIVACSIFA